MFEELDLKIDASKAGATVMVVTQAAFTACYPTPCCGPRYSETCRQ